MIFQQTLNNLKNKIIAKLVKNNISPKEAEIETEILIEHVFGLRKKDWLLNPDLELSQDKTEELNSLVNRRNEEKIPVQYLANKAHFMGEEFYVDKNVLIPRPETELLVEEVLNIVGKDFKIIDIGTGSGCIAIMLAKNLLQAQIIASDISEKALEVAKLNAKKLGVIDKINFIQSDIFENIDSSEKFDIVVSNPPYISIKERENLQIEVQKHEPASALFVEDEQGISFYEKLAEQAALRLNPNGLIAVEIGFSQAESVKQIFEKNGFKDIKIIKDLAGIERVITGKKYFLVVP